jgi:hypothetical protein
LESASLGESREVAEKEDLQPSDETSEGSVGEPDDPEA